MGTTRYGSLRQCEKKEQDKSAKERRKVWEQYSTKMSDNVKERENDGEHESVEESLKE